MNAHVRWAWRLLLPVTALAAAAPIARAEIVDGVAVVVNGDVITLSELEQRPGLVLPTGDDPDSKERRHIMLQRAAEDAATEHLVNKECADEGITPTPAEIDNAIEDVQRTNGNIDRATLEKALQAQGMSMPMYRDMLSEQLCQMKIVETKVKPRIQVTDDDVRAAYNQMVADTHPTRELKLRDIFVSSQGGIDPARARIEEARRRIVAGEDFSMVAKETGGPLAANGGDLGWMKESDIAPALKPVVNLPKGGVSQIIVTPEGMHLLKVDDVRTLSGVQPLGDVFAQLKAQIVKKRLGKAVEDYLKDLLRNADVEYKLP